MAVRCISTKLAIEGENEYRSGVKEINVELKTLGSELKLVESSFKGQSNSQAALTAKGDALARTYSAQADKVSKLGDALKNAQEAQGAYNSRIETLNAKISANEAEMDKLKVSTLDTSEAQAKLTEKTAALKKELDEAYGYETAAAKGVSEWQRQLNLAQVDLNSLNAEIKQNDKYLDEAKRSADGCATSIDNYGKQTKDASEKSGLLQKIFAGGFLANIASNALSTVGNWIKSLGTAALETADELERLKSVTGFTTTELQKWTYIGDDVGVSLDTITSAEKKLIKAMSEARDGTGDQAKAFKAIGVSVTDAQGNLRSANAVMMEAFDALSKIGNETERDALTLSLFGRSATELNPLIEAGSDALNKLGNAAESTGTVMSEDAVAALDATGDSLDHAKQKAESLVGEGLAKIIDKGKTAAETMDDLNESLAESGNTQRLIEKYRTLSAEISDSSLTSEELTKKTEELEETKQSLITASKGVVTATNNENGSFDRQVDILETMTEAEKTYAKLKLESFIIQNTGAEAKKKLTEATEKQAAALSKVEEYQAKVDELSAQGADPDKIERWNATLSAANYQLSVADIKLAQVGTDSTSAQEQARNLVEQGLLPVADAAGLCQMTVEEFNVAVRGMSEELAAAPTVIQDMVAQIDSLNAEYQAAYESSLSSLQGQYDLWSKAPDVVQTSVAEMQAALDSNTEYFANYKTNIETLMTLNIPGVDMQPLIDSISDGTPEAAARAQALADAIRNGDTDAVAALAESAANAKASQEALAAEMGKAATDYDKKWKDIVNSTADAVKKMDKTDEANQSGINTLQGYINGVSSKSAALNITMSSAAQAAMDAWKKQLDEHSPSRKMIESGKNTIKGAIIGVDSMKAALTETYADMGRKLLDGLSKGMKDSSGKVMSTADDIAKELTTRLGDMTGVFSASSDVSELKYKLWALTSGKGATGAQSAEAEIASLTEQAQLEEKQITATQTAYAKMIALQGETGEESLKLQKQLLQEQIAYENLKKSIEDANAAKKAVATDTLPAMADQEYKLWYMENPDASNAEKLAREAEVLNLKMAVQSETVDEAAAALDEMVAKYGANADGSIKLREELLKEKIAYAELKKAIDELNEAKSKYDSSGADVPANFMQSAAIWDSLTVKKVSEQKATTTGGVSAQDLKNMFATAVNAVGTVVSQRPSGDLTIEIPVNGKPFCRAIISDFRAVDSASPKVVSDKL